MSKEMYTYLPLSGNEGYMNIGRYRTCGCIIECDHWQELLQPVTFTKKPTKDMPVGKNRRAKSKPSERKPGESLLRKDDV